jgi:hypothetical protein
MINRYLIIWTNQRNLTDGSVENYEMSILHDSLDKSIESFELTSEICSPCRLIDLQELKVLKEKTKASYT